MVKKINIINWIFPYFEMRNANNIINEKIKMSLIKIDNNQNSEYIEKLQNISLIEAEKNFNVILSNRKSLEEKAKVNVLIVTIAVTVILGLSSFLFSIQENLPDSNYFNLILLFLFSSTFFYLVSGSLTSLEALNGGQAKEVYNLSPEDYSYLVEIGNKKLREKELVYFYSRNSELNTMINWKINNLISCTYSNIKNALIILGIIGVVFCILFTFFENKKSVEAKFVEQNHIQSLKGINYDLYILMTDKKLDEIQKQQQKILDEIQKKYKDE